MSSHVANLSQYQLGMSTSQVLSHLSTKARGRTNTRAKGRTRTRARGRTRTRAKGRTRTRAKGRTRTRDWTKVLELGLGPGLKPR